MTVSERSIKSAKDFVAEHGTPVRAVVENIGRKGARVVLVGPDGAMGDVLVASVELGEKLVGSLDDLTVAGWDAATTNSTKIGPAHRRRMAGKGNLLRSS